MSSPTLDQIAALLPEAQAEVAQLEQQITADAQANADLAEKLDAATATAAQEAQQVTDLTGQLTQAQQDAVKAIEAAKQAKLISDGLAAQLKDLAARYAQAQTDRSNLLMDVCAGRVAPISYTDLHLAPLGVEGLNTWHDAGGTKADTNPGTTVKPHGTPSYVLNGDGTALLTFQPAASFDNLFLFRVLNSPATLEKATDLRSFMVPAQYKAGTRCIEIQREWNDGHGWRYNFAYQFNFVSNVVRIFDYTQPDSNKAWVPTSVPLPDFSQWVTVQGEFDIDTVNHVTVHRGMWINGTFYPVNQTFKAANVGGTGRKYTVAIQLDTQSTPKGATVPPMAGVLIGATAGKDLL